MFFMLLFATFIIFTYPTGAKTINQQVEDRNEGTDLAASILPREQRSILPFDFMSERDAKRCYPPYGCFCLKSPWTDENRGIPEFPQSDRKINPKFLLYTREQRGRFYPLRINNEESIKNSPIKTGGYIHFIIHGFWDNGSKTWVPRIVRKILEREDSNIVVVDWIKGARTTYSQAVANTRLVGAMTARLVSQLIEMRGISPTKIHVIGHSLGAHTAGYVGYHLRNRYGYTLGRITGLDPAGPFFSNTPPLVRLDPTDADFVTAIHTDIEPLILKMGLGIREPVGHIDFYPNGGRAQPICDEDSSDYIDIESIIHGVEEFVSCNHRQSIEYFIKSIDPVCPFLSVHCKSWKEFRRGNCFNCTNHYCPKFGFDAQPRNDPASVYLMIPSDNEPVCKGHYRVEINISDSKKSIAHGGEIGMFVMKVIGANGKMTEELQLNETPLYFNPGSTHTVVLSGDIVGKLQAVKLTWKDEELIIMNPLAMIGIKSKIYIHSLTIESLETGEGMTVCPDGKETFIENKGRILNEENCPRQ